MCVVVVKSAVAVWRHLYFCKIPLIITNTLTHTRKQMNTHSLELGMLLSLSHCRSNKLLSAMQTHHSLTHSLTQGPMYCVGSKSE